MSQSQSERNQIVADMIAQYGEIVTRTQTKQFEAKTGQSTRFIRATFPKVGRGQFVLKTGAVPSKPSTMVSEKTKVKKTVEIAAAEQGLPVESRPVSIVTSETPSTMAMVVNADTSKSDVAARLQALADAAGPLARVPERSPSFVPFGDFDVVRKIIKTKSFLPVIITGLSGNGKTFQIEQACAMEKREYIRANITIETDEDDLLGGFRLKNGETVFEPGPVVIAMLRGSVLLIDEFDLGGSKMMCLQPVLEGKPLTLKKLGVTIYPVPGFQIFATANTKGQGNEDGRFVGTQLVNEAFLERFPITVEQTYPAIQVEKKILSKTWESVTGQAPDADQATFFETLSRWADMVRTTYMERAIDQLISTRRLVHIVKTYAIFGNKDRALALCLARFDQTVQAKLLDFYSKLDPTGAEAAPTGAVPDGDENKPTDINF